VGPAGGASDISQILIYLIPGVSTPDPTGSDKPPAHLLPISLANHFCVPNVLLWRRWSFLGVFRSAYASNCFLLEMPFHSSYHVSAT